ncbi:MAG: hypothetical protein LBU94_02005, partial [Clostridiales bacterium]|nr:hypothetical protein [Clostridiales bacterium]
MDYDDKTRKYTGLNSINNSVKRGSRRLSDTTDSGVYYTPSSKKEINRESRSFKRDGIEEYTVPKRSNVSERARGSQRTTQRPQAETQ